MYITYTLYCILTDHLKEKLDEYVAKLPVPVNIQRIPVRGGLIRARLKGKMFNVHLLLHSLDALNFALKNGENVAICTYQLIHSTTECNCSDIVRSDEWY